MQPSQYATPYSSDPPTDVPATDNPPVRPVEPARPRARMAIVVPTAVVTAVVIIAATANEWATKQMLKTHGEARLYFGGWSTFSWRFGSRPFPRHYLAGQFALIGTTLVLTGLLTWALLHGAITWVRAFFGTWLAVLFATVAGSIVRGFIVRDFVRDLSTGSGDPRSSRLTFALFGPYGPSNSAVFAGLLLGLVVGALTSLVAMVSRRPAAGAAVVPAIPPGPPSFADYAPPPSSHHGGPPPWQDQHYGPPSGASLVKEPPNAQPPGPPNEQPAGPPNEQPAGPPNEQPAGTPAEPVGEQATTRLPVAPEAPRSDASREPVSGPPADQPTTQLTPPAEPAAERPAETPEGPPTQAMPTSATTRFPRPPDDEELGHIEH